MFASFTTKLPWESCTNSWNTENCSTFSTVNETLINSTVNNNHLIDSTTEYWEWVRSLTKLYRMSHNLIAVTTYSYLTPWSQQFTGSHNLCFAICHITTLSIHLSTVWPYMSTLHVTHSYGVSVILSSLKTFVPETKISVIWRSPRYLKNAYIFLQSIVKTQPHFRAFKLHARAGALAIQRDSISLYWPVSLNGVLLHYHPENISSNSIERFDQ